MHPGGAATGGADPGGAGGGRSGEPAAGGGIAGRRPREALHRRVGGGRRGGARPSAAPADLVFFIFFIF